MRSSRVRPTVFSFLSRNLISFGFCSSVTSGRPSMTTKVSCRSRPRRTPPRPGPPRGDDRTTAPCWVVILHRSVQWPWRDLFFCSFPRFNAGSGCWSGMEKKACGFRGLRRAKRGCGAHQGRAFMVAPQRRKWARYGTRERKNGRVDTGSREGLDIARSASRKGRITVRKDGRGQTGCTFSPSQALESGSVGKAGLSIDPSST
ncbi:hypothetical protein VTK73DRAFT_5089 [Phialemonium thermophilum]|uniref:Uncharacterized protein n=1 Tax=Phialemonium thermophilum TaxID=223376 RepID=A0ABR3V3M6_9PEZI